MNVLHIQHQLELRTLSFIHSYISSFNPLVKATFAAAMCDARSDLGFNIAFFRYKYGIVFRDDLTSCRKRMSDLIAVDDETRANIVVVKELIDCREELALPHFGQL